MKISNFLSVFLLSLFIISCEEDPTPDPDFEPIVEESFPMNPENSWIYKRTQTDTSGLLVFTDTVTITGVETIRGEQYFQFKNTSPLYLNELVRDSSDYLVDQFGNILFSYDEAYEGIGTVLIPGTNPQFRFDYIMGDDLENVTVPAGTFECRTYDVIIQDLRTDPLPDRTSYTKYSKGTGLISQRIYYTSGGENPIDIELVEANIR